MTVGKKRRENTKKRLAKKRAREATDPDKRSTRMTPRRAVIGDREAWDGKR